MQEYKTELKDDNDHRQTWVIVDGIPQLNDSADYQKYANLLEETAQHFASAGSKKQPIVYIPHETKKTKHSDEVTIDGCALIQFGSTADANKFVAGYEQNPKIRPLNLSCFTWREIQKFESLPDEYAKQTKQEFQDERNLLFWLLDEPGGESYRDQYAIRFQGAQFEETHIYWNDENEVKEGRALCYDATDLKRDRKEMTRQYIEWSPNGLYLLTTHPKGVALWGGPNWKRLQRLEHHRVDKMSFSPNEKYLITCNSQPYTANNQKIQPVIKIWDVLCGELIREVPYNTIGPAIKLRLPGWWPIFKWSADERYIAKINSSKKMGAKPKDINRINVFEVRDKTTEELEDSDDDENESFYVIQKLGGKSITVDSLFDLSFSPRDNILSYTTFAQNNDQATMNLLQIPTKNQLKVQTLGFDVKKAHLHWQSQGKYLAAIMGHSQSATKYKIVSHSIGIMTVYMKNYPFSRTDKLGKIIDFSWEPNNNRFAVIHNNKSKRDNPDISIYRVGSVGVKKQFEGSARLIHKFENIRVNELHWAPHGGRLIIANVDKARRAGGEIEFIDVNKIGLSGKKVNGDTIKQCHEGMTDISWDPSGRYLITATTQFLGTMSGDDTRYIVWSFQGEKLFQHNLKHFYQIEWRPRPQTIKGLELNKTDKQSAKSKLNNGWDSLFKKHDISKISGAETEIKARNLKKVQYFNKLKMSFIGRSNDILAKRNNILLNSGYKPNWTWERIKKQMVKSQNEMKINRETMKKIIDGEHVDFSKF